MANSSNDLLHDIPIERLSRGRYQPRRVFAEDALKELSASIQSAGLIQPLVVRALDDEHYEIIAGERRWRAAQMAGLSKVPCLVKHLTDSQAAAMAMIENIQRQDLNAIEEARAFQRLINEFSYTHEEVAALVGKSRAMVSNSLRLLQLSEKAQEALVSNRVSVGHAKVLASLNLDLQNQLVEQCVRSDWSIKKLTQQAQQLSTQQTSSDNDNAQDLLRLETIASEQFGAPVKLEDGNEQGGWLKIRYYDNDTLAGLLDKIGVEYE